MIDDRYFNGARRQILIQSTIEEDDSPKCNPKISAGIPDSELAFSATLRLLNFSLNTGAIASTALDFPAEPVTPTIKGWFFFNTSRAQNLSHHKTGQRIIFFIEFIISEVALDVTIDRC